MHDICSKHVNPMNCPRSYSLYCRSMCQSGVEHRRSPIKRMVIDGMFESFAIPQIF